MRSHDTLPYSYGLWLYGWLAAGPRGQRLWNCSAPGSVRVARCCCRRRRRWFQQMDEPAAEQQRQTSGQSQHRDQHHGASGQRHRRRVQDTRSGTPSLAARAFAYNEG